METNFDKNTQYPSGNKTLNQSQIIHIERTFQVPEAQLFAAFTNAEAIKKWWWPKTLFTDRVDYDFREGGKYFINMKGMANAGGGGMVGEFSEIIPNKKIVMSDQFADENGNVISSEEAKMPGGWPTVITITFEFETVNEGTSKMILTQEGIPQEVQEECVQGWNESFDKLEQYLSAY